MTTPPNSRFLARAQGHRDRAQSYLDDANLLLTQYDKRDSAGALLYESAKQCINAIANRNGQNPGATGAKTRYLETFATESAVRRYNLAESWDSAMQLHIHADRGHLSAQDFEEAWLSAQAFIANMLGIYAGGP